MDDIDKQFKYFNAKTEHEKGNIAGLILMNYVKNNKLKLLKQMVNKGFGIDTMNQYALITASFHGHYSIAEYLIELGMDISILGNKPLECSIENGHKDVTKLLNYHLRKQKLEKILEDKHGHKIELTKYR